MGCHPSHWRTPSFFKMGKKPPTRIYGIPISVSRSHSWADLIWSKHGMTGKPETNWVFFLQCGIETLGTVQLKANRGKNDDEAWNECRSARVPEWKQANPYGDIFGMWGWMLFLLNRFDVFVTNGNFTFSTPLCPRIGWGGNVRPPPPSPLVLMVKTWFPVHVYMYIYIIIYIYVYIYISCP